MQYGTGLKARMVRWMTGSHPMSATALAREAGIPQPTLSKWLREAGRVRPVKQRESSQGAPRPMQPKRPPDWTAAEKLEAVVAAARLSEAALRLLQSRFYRTPVP